MKTKILNFALALVLLAVGLGTSSCTLSEPKLEDGTASNSLLQKVSIFGMTQLLVSYDDQYRITKISSPMYELVVELSYSSSDKYPYAITQYEYDEDELIESETWQNIIFNSNGHITAYECHEEGRYYPDGTQTSHYGISYNSRGQITEIYCDNLLEKRFFWNGGLLETVVEYDSEGIIDETKTIEYSNIENTAGVWSMNWEIDSILMNFGFFGYAPEKFISKITQKYGYGYADDESVQFAYQIGSGGLISSEKIGTSDWDWDYDTDERVEYITTVTCKYSYINK